ncbi:MAG: hypothetical protein WCS33_00400 [Candidatus Caldatribacteriota bacterium]
MIITNYLTWDIEYKEWVLIAVDGVEEEDFTEHGMTQDELDDALLPANIMTKTAEHSRSFYEGEEYELLIDLLEMLTINEITFVPLGAGDLFFFIKSEDGILYFYIHEYDVWEPLLDEFENPITEEELTDELYRDYGMTVLDGLDRDVLLELGNSLKFLFWTDIEDPEIRLTFHDVPEYNPLDLLDADVVDLMMWTDDIEEGNEWELQKKAIPKGQLNRTKNLPIQAADRITNMTVNATTSGNGIVNLIISTDQGQSWKAFDGSQWLQVIDEPEEVKANGMPPGLVNSISKAQWGALTNNQPPGLIRLGVYLEQDEYEDEAQLEAVDVEFTFGNRYEDAKQVNKYHWENTKLIVRIYENGTFRINYPDD